MMYSQGWHSSRGAVKSHAMAGFAAGWSRPSSSTRTSRLFSSKDHESGLFGMAGDYIKSFRLKAAEKLSSNLSVDEKRRMEEHTKAEQSERDREGNMKTAYGGKNQPSIEELLAETKAKEAQRVKGEMEEEWQQREADVERAVRKRLESDLELQRRQIAFEKWKEDLEREKQQQQQQSEAPGEDASVDVAASSVMEALGEHPILGPTICDLGHKRVCLSSTERLASLPVWEKQRFFRHERAKKMARDKVKSLHIGLPGVIGIYERTDGSLAIIDGQHRVGMLKILSEKKGVKEDFDFDKILVEVYSQPENVSADEYATKIFEEINKAQPANLIDLPGAVKAEHLEIINRAVTSISERYADMFKPSTKCRRPHLNIDNVRNDLFLNEVLERNDIKSAKDLELWMLTKNDDMMKKYETDEAARKKVEGQDGTIYKKAQQYGFYLGLENSWYNE